MWVLISCFDYLFIQITTSRRIFSMYASSKNLLQLLRFRKLLFSKVEAFQDSIDDGAEEARGRHRHQRSCLRNGETRPFNGVHVTGFHTVR